MKILVVQDTDWVRRNPIQHNHLAERLVQKGHEIRVIDYDILWKTEKHRRLLSPRQVFTLSRIIPNAEHQVIRPSIIRLPILDYFSMLFTYRSEIMRQIHDFQPDIIYMDTILTAYLASGMGRRKNIKTIYYCIDKCYRLIPYPFLRPLGKLIERQNMKTADRVVSINQKLCEYTIRMGAKTDKTAVIRAGIDCHKYSPEIDGSKIRAKYGFKDTDKVLCFVGWLYHFSGLKEVVEAISKLKDNSIKLLVVGDGDAFECLQNVIHKLGLEDKVVMVGKQPYEAIPEFMAAADIFLLPAYDNDIMHDIVPIKMYEYMAMGRPVIATRLPGVMAEFGIDNGVIYVDKPADVVGKAIELFATNQVKALGAKARNYVAQYSWESIADQFERLLQEVIVHSG